MRDAEARSRKFSDGARAELAAQLQVIRQKLQSAQLLWAHRQYVECLRLAGEGVTEAVGALALAEEVLGDDLSERTRRMSARAVGLTTFRLRFNAELTDAARAYFERAVAFLLDAVDELTPLARPPRELVIRRWARLAVVVAGLLVVSLAGAVVAYQAYGRRATLVQQRERASRDGYLFREEGSNTVFVVQAGARLPISSAQEFNALGYLWPAVEVVPAGSLEHLRLTLPDNVLIKDRGNPATYLVEGGKKRLVSSPEVLERLRRERKGAGPIRVVPSGALGSMPAGDPIR